MSTKIGGRTLQRSNKDLGRILAIARLSDEPEVENWPAEWAEVLKEKFGKEWPSLARQAGEGLRQLLTPGNEPDFEEAHHSGVFGLLASQPPTVDELRATGERVLQFCITPLEKLAR